MAVIEYDEYKQRLLALEPTLGELEKALGIPKAREELAELQKETEQEGFWNDLERSQQVSRQVKRLENKIKKHDKLVSEWEDTLTLCEMAQEEDDPSQLDDVVEGYNTLEKEISERRLAALLSGEYDGNNAILAFSQERAKLPKASNCIQCGRCVNACPLGLAAKDIVVAFNKGNVELLNQLHADLCMSCGTCSFVCPAKRPLTPSIALAKIMMKNGGKK